jgi:hypothetical protein
MFQKFTKRFFIVTLAIVLVGVNSLGYAGSKMKDIELDPGKGDNVGNHLALITSASAVAVDFFVESDGIVTLGVFDMQGRSVDSGAEGFVPKARMHESVVDVSNLQNGIYFVRLTHQNGTVMTAKFLVAH